MSKFTTAIQLTKKPRLFFCALCQHYLTWLPDRLYLKLLFYLKMGDRLNLKHPQTFSEKIQWLKLYNRKDEYTKMVDKYAVKEYVASLIGDEYIIPTLGVWQRVEDIDWEALPNQFVLKTTHGGGGSGVVICTDKTCFDRKKAIKQLNRSLHSDIYRQFKEWPYKNVKRQIIAEKYIGELGSNDVLDYKFFCFNGEPKIMFIASERNNVLTDTKFDFFDMNFKHLPIVNGHPNSSQTFQMPTQFAKMKYIASILSQNIPHVRVDMYYVNNQILFGELTFFHFGGFVPFEPKEWDFRLGKLLHLS